MITYHINDEKGSVRMSIRGTAENFKSILEHSRGMSKILDRPVYIVGKQGSSTFVLASVYKNSTSVKFVDEVVEEEAVSCFVLEGEI